MSSIKLSNLDQTKDKNLMYISKIKKIATFTQSATIFDRDMPHCTSLLSLAMATLPSLLYFMGEPPSWMRVPYPVGVKNAGMPAPPARILSANVPWDRNE